MKKIAHNHISVKNRYAIIIKPDRSYVCQAVPGIDFVDVPDVVFSSEDGEQASVGVIELNKQRDEHYT